ncbi:MAG: uncharacterized membrane protein YbaN (DUF454 family) [Candidatus Azotimanducaceae bacterium]|jgi:uncharacterized membrane protein YbaN (DUF454 family)
MMEIISTMKDKMPTNTRHVPAGKTAKVVYTIIAVLLLIIGIAGLLVPIIPGVLFLVGAVLIFSKVSTRVHRWSEGQRWVSGARIRMIQLQGLHPLAKIRFLALLGAQAVVSGIVQLGQFSARLFRRS